MAFEGGVTVGGDDISKMKRRNVARLIALMPQAAEMYFQYTCYQTVLLGRSARIGAFRSPKEEDMEVAERVMKRLGIWELADKPCHAISGGELQMVLIARAMAAEPELLVLDEPESNLDFRNQLVVLDTMTSLAAEGMACIFNTHYPAHALQRADKSLLLTKGGMSIYGPTKYVVSEDDIRSIFGVNAIIGDFEAEDSTVQSVIPVSISK